MRNLFLIRSESRSIYWSRATIPGPLIFMDKISKVLFDDFHQNNRLPHVALPDLHLYGFPWSSICSIWLKLTSMHESRLFLDLMFWGSSFYKLNPRLFWIFWTCCIYNEQAVIFPGFSILSTRASSVTAYRVRRCVGHGVRGAEQGFRRFPSLRTLRRLSLSRIFAHCIEIQSGIDYWVNLKQPMFIVYFGTPPTKLEV